ncbi:hypothetical protein NKJ35_28350 [Mesorhizobium sp. M0136]|uniref:hypothetical protein n=1 Tax=Mesorhizobium sp. M0136 TaxID=2956890 RepID=UPI0033364DCA
MVFELGGEQRHLYPCQMFGVDLPTNNQKAAQQYVRIIALKAARCAYPLSYSLSTDVHRGNHSINDGFDTAPIMMAQDDFSRLHDAGAARISFHPKKILRLHYCVGKML